MFDEPHHYLNPPVSPPPTSSAPRSPTSATSSPSGTTFAVVDYVSDSAFCTAAPTPAESITLPYGVRGVSASSLMVSSPLGTLGSVPESLSFNAITQDLDSTKLRRSPPGTLLYVKTLRASVSVSMPESSTTLDRRPPWRTVCGKDHPYPHACRLEKPTVEDTVPSSYRFPTSPQRSIPLPEGTVKDLSDQDPSLFSHAPVRDRCPPGPQHRGSLTWSQHLSGGQRQRVTPSPSPSARPSLYLLGRPSLAWTPTGVYHLPARSSSVS
jgi:hypothetical protein